MTKKTKKTKIAVGDVSDAQRTFIVYVDRKVPGLEPAYETVVVEPGEDADSICADIVTGMLANEVDSGWYEK